MKGLHTLFRPAIWVGLLGVAGKGMSALCGIMLAYRFGAGQATDAYLLAKTLPIGFYLIVDSIVYNTLVPLLRRPERMDATFRTLAVLFFFGATAFAACVYFGAAQIIAWLARGADSATQTEAIQLQRITAWAIIYAVPASCLKAWNASQSRYVAASLDGFVLSGVLLVTLLATPDRYGITPVAIALPAAFVVLLLIQGGLAHQVIRMQPHAEIGELPGRYLSKLMTPLFFLNGIQQIQILIVVALASFYGSGALSQVNYSYAIAQIPVGVLDLILFSTLFPFAAQLAANRRFDDLLRAFHGAALTLLVLSVPVAAWVVLMRGPIVEVLLTRGDFDASDAGATSALLLGHGLAIPAWVLEALACRVLFALGQHGRYLGAVAIRLVCFAALAPLLLHFFALSGISLAFAASFLAGACWSTWAVLRLLPATPVLSRRGLLAGAGLVFATTVAVILGSLLIRGALDDLEPVYPLVASGILVAGMVSAALFVAVGQGYFQRGAPES